MYRIVVSISLLNTIVSLKSRAEAQGFALPAEINSSLGCFIANLGWSLDLGLDSNVECDKCNVCFLGGM